MLLVGRVLSFQGRNDCFSKHYSFLKEDSKERISVGDKFNGKVVRLDIGEGTDRRSQ